MTLRLPSIIPQTTQDNMDGVSFQQQLQDGLASLSFHAALPDALDSLKQMMQWQPAPIVVSDRPDAARIAQQQQQQALSGRAEAMPSLTAPPPTPATPRTPGSQPDLDLPSTTASVTAMPSQPGPAPQAGGDLRAYARSVAQRYGLDPDIFERQIHQESGFNPQAVSPAGAQGIAQFMPATARGMGLADPFEPYAALDAAARHMRDNLARNGGDYARALAAYNAGQGAVDQYGGVPPYQETQTYIRNILGGRAAPVPTAPTSPTGAGSPFSPPPGPSPTQAAPGGGSSRQQLTIRNKQTGAVFQVSDLDWQLMTNRDLFEIMPGQRQGSMLPDLSQGAGAQAALVFPADEDAQRNGRTLIEGAAPDLAQGQGVQRAMTFPEDVPPPPGAPPTSSYNDPTDGGTQAQPLPVPVQPSYNDPAAGGTQTTPLPLAQPAYPSPSDDPGGAVQRAQDSQSTSPPSGVSPYDETPPYVPPVPSPPSQVSRSVPSYAPQAAQVQPAAPRPLVEPRVADVAQRIAAGLPAVFQVGAEAAQTSYNDPLWQQAPALARAVKLISDTTQAAGGALGRQVAEAVDIPDDEVLRVFGQPITRHQLWEAVGGMLADPTGYVGGGEAKPVVREAVNVAGPVAREAASAVGRGARALAEEGAGRLLDLTPSPGVVQRGTGGVARAAEDAAPEAAPTFYSQLRRVLDEKMPNRAMPGQVQGIIASGGVKPDEVVWTGLDDWLRQQRGPVTKQQVLDFLDQNGVKVEEVVKGGPAPDLAWERLDQNTWRAPAPNGRGDYFQVDRMPNGKYRVRTPGGMDNLADTAQDAVAAAQADATNMYRPNTKYGQYTLPGGKNYRELLLTLPPKNEAGKLKIVPDPEQGYYGIQNQATGEWMMRGETMQVAENYLRSLQRKTDEATGVYSSPHWDEPNILAHVRFNDRVSADGKKTLLIEEVQSDWGAANRKALSEVSKPQGVRELAQNVFGRELTSVMPVDQVDGGVLSALQHDQVQRAVVASLPVNVVNDLRAAQLSPEDLFRNPNMLVTRLSPDHLRAVADGLLTGIRRVGTDLRAKLLLASQTRRNAELLPALKASDLDAREVVGLLAPERLYHVGLPSGASGAEIAGARAEGLLGSRDVTRRGAVDRSTAGAGGIGGREGAANGAKTPTATTGANGEAAPASLARLLDWHTQIVRESGASPQTRYMPGPFVGSTDNYASLALKRMIRWAAEHGYDRIAWPPGQVHADRYSLARQVSKLEYLPEEQMLRAYDPQGAMIIGRTVPPNELGGMVGQEVAQKLLAQPAHPGPYDAPMQTLEGQGLHVGGEGMKGFYDQILPAVAQKLGKKFGARVGETEITRGGDRSYVVLDQDRNVVATFRTQREADREARRLRNRDAQWGNNDYYAVPQDRGMDAMTVHSMDITPSMRESVVRQGQPLFAGVPFDPASAALGAGAGAETDENGNPIVDPWRAGGGALALGMLGNRFPGAAKALQASQRRAANIAAKGLQRPSAWDWIKQAGYSGIYGPATAASSVIGGAQELTLGNLKEGVRALVQGNPRGYAAQARAQIQAVPDALTGLARVLGDDAASAARASGGSQGTANLSERVVSPLAHDAARALERPGEILTEAPDAVFRPLFLAQGMQREAGRVAREVGLRGQQAQVYADQLVQDAAAVRTGQLPVLPGTQRVIDAGQQYADQLGYKGKPGGFAQWLGNVSKRDDPIGVIASFLVPFPAMASRVTEAALKSTPGIGLLPGVRALQPTKFDVVYDQAFGTLVAAGLGYWAFNGGITGSGPADAEKRRQMIDQGWQPNSTLIAGHYIPNRLFQRFAPMLDIAGEIHDALAYGKPGAKPKDLVNDLVKRSTSIATDQVGLSGLADLNDMLTNGFSSQFPGFAARSIVRYLPYGGVIRAGATATDPLQRRAEKWGDEAVPVGPVAQNLEMAIPGLRQNVPAVQTSLGQDAPNPQYGLGAVFPRVTTQRDDPTIRAFQQSGVDIGAPPDQLTIDAIPMPLTPAEQRQWNTARGEILQRFATGLTQRSWWNTPAAREMAMKELLQQANDAADERMKRTIGAAEIRRRLLESRDKMKQARAS